MENECARKKTAKFFTPTPVFKIRPGSLAVLQIFDIVQIKKMKTKSSLIIVLIFIQISCVNSDDSNSIRPINTIRNHLYSKDDFIELPKDYKENGSLWQEMNQSDYEISVHIKNDELVFAKLNYENQFFELRDGNLEIINNGEFGGALNFIPTDKKADTISICEIPVNFVFNFKKRIYFMVGIAHMEDTGGAIFELKRESGNFSYKEVIKLDSAPEAIAIYKNKILIAGHRMFTIVEDFKKNNIIENAFWHSLYPNSIAVKNENNVYVGMRGGYSKLSLNTKEIKYYKYKGK